MQLILQEFANVIIIIIICGAQFRSADTLHKDNQMSHAQEWKEAEEEK